jgi:hypothetical protein
MKKVLIIIAAAVAVGIVWVVVMGAALSVIPDPMPTPSTMQQP